MKTGNMPEKQVLCLLFIDVEKAVVNDIAKDLCAFFRQESVLVTESEIQAYFVSEKPECNSERDSGNNKK